MKVSRLLLVCLVACLSLARLSAAPAKVAGEWKLTVELPVGTGHPTLSLKQDGERLTGVYEGRYGASPVEGVIKETKISLTVSMKSDGAATSGVFSGVVDGDTMSGTVAFPEIGDGTWTAVRAPAK